MNVIRWNPFRELDEFWGRYGEPTRDVSARDWVPPVDIRETENDYRVDVELPAVAPEDVNVTLKDGLLTVSGERTVEKAYAFYRKDLGTYESTATGGSSGVVWGSHRDHLDCIGEQEFASDAGTTAEVMAWVADGRPIYGGFFWINGTERFPIPKDAYYMAGAGGQFTIIIPSHDLVVVRMGHYKGSSVGYEALRESLKLLMQVVPASEYM